MGPVTEAERRKLEEMVEQSQAEPDEAKAHGLWTAIEKMVFGVDLPDIDEPGE